MNTNGQRVFRNIFSRLLVLLIIMVAALLMVRVAFAIPIVSAYKWDSPPSGPIVCPNPHPLFGTAPCSAGFITDLDYDGLADPGDTLRYVVGIVNSGTMDLINTEFFDTIDTNTTVVPGSVKTYPIARNDNYATVTNVGIVVPAASGVLANDNDPDGTTPVLTIFSFDATSTNGGSLALASDGSFSYDPSPGYGGVDSFEYTILDSDGDADSAWVHISISSVASVDSAVAFKPKASELVSQFLYRIVSTFSVSPSFASGESIYLDIGDLNPGQVAIIFFDVTVDTTIPSNVTQLCNQGFITSDNHPDELTDDSNVGGSTDPTCTPADPPLSKPTSTFTPLIPPTPTSTFTPLIPPTPTSTFTPLIPPTPTSTFTPLIPPTPTSTFTPLIPPSPTSTFTPLIPPTPTSTFTPLIPPTPTSTFTPLIPPTPTSTNTPLIPPTPTSTNTPPIPPTPTPTSTSESDLTYVSFSTGGTAGGVAFKDEDILVHDSDSGTWSMVFDGSDVGVGNNDLDGFAILDDGSILVSFQIPRNMSGLGRIDDSDILRFVPTTLGSNTTGTFEKYFDGSDVGLTRGSEDVDAIEILSDGRLLISTLGAYRVSGLSGRNQDLIAFTPTSLGTNTSGTWELYFDGSDVSLNRPLENVWGTSVEGDSGEVYLTTFGYFSVPGLNGFGSDIFACDPTSIGSSTNCSFSSFWSSWANGVVNRVDGITISE